MPDRRYSSVAKRRMAAPAPLVWALLADTNRWDRAAGLSLPTYAFEAPKGGDPPVRVGSNREMGFEVRWREPPYEWVESRRLVGERVFVEGPVHKGGTRVELRATPQGTEVEAEAWVEGDGALSRLVGPIAKMRLGAALEKYLDAIEKVLADKVQQGMSDDEPPASIMRRMLLCAPAEGITSGPVSHADEAQLTFCAKRFNRTAVDPEMRKRIVDFVQKRPDEELTGIRPFELARAWGVDRRELLRGFLHAARSGLLDLQWQVNCPTCRVASETHARLESVSPRSHCPACDISFDLDFGEHVEAVFHVSEAIRKVKPQLYCASSPWFRPHVFAQVPVAAGASRELQAPLPRGPLLIRVVPGARQMRVQIDDPGPKNLRLRVTPKELSVELSTEPAEAGETRLVAGNETDKDVLVLVERVGDNADVVLGSVIATLPDFHDLFSSEAPASGVDLTIRALTLLFSDLTGSTALYEKVGDARAFALVKEHFDHMAVAVHEHRGAIVKTMGDAVMATFPSPQDAMRAAVAMVEATRREHGSSGMSLKVGLHEGPCLAVRANDRLDFFGSTVNIAARLQAQAKPGEIVVAAELLSHEGVAAVVSEAKMSGRAFEAALKGVSRTQSLIALAG